MISCHGRHSFLIVCRIVGDDYAAVDRDFVFLANESTVAVEIELVNDEIAERNESFSLSLSGLEDFALVYDIISSQASVDILNDDCKFVGLVCIWRWFCSVLNRQCRCFDLHKFGRLCGVGRRWVCHCYFNQRGRK